MLCSIRGCDQPVEARDWCNKHYLRWRRHGDPTTTLRPGLGLSDHNRFYRFVDTTGDCWEWTGFRDKDGYGAFKQDGLYKRASRVAWELHNGPIPAGLQIDHLCENPPCVRVDHLQPVTPRRNITRSKRTAAGINARKTHCVNGHPFDEENTRWTKQGYRQCRSCERGRARRKYAKRRGMSYEEYEKWLEPYENY